MEKILDHIIGLGILMIAVWTVVTLVFMLVKKIFVQTFGENYIITMKYVDKHTHPMEMVDKTCLKAMSRQGAYAKYVSSIVGFDDMKIISIDVSHINGI